MTSPLLPFALRYASQGLVVMPLRRLDNRPHGMLGQFSETGGFRTVGSTDPNTIHRWWRLDPAANIGVVCGKRSRWITLDCDVKHGNNGVISLMEWQELYNRELPETQVIHTPSGGMHLHFRLPRGVDIRKYDGWLEGVDVRGSGGLVAMPPSAKMATVVEQHTTWQMIRTYRRDSDPIDALPDDPAASLRWILKVPEAPDWLLNDIGVVKPGSRRRTGRHAGINLPPTEDLQEAGFKPGKRSDQCFALACRLLRVHQEPEPIIHEVWRRTPQVPDPFTWSEALNCIQSARRSVGES